MTQESALQKRAEELAALHTVSLNISATRDLPAMLQAIVEQAALLLHAPGGAVYLTDPTARTVRCAVSFGLSKDYTGTTLAYGEGVAGAVAASGQPLNIPDYQSWAGRALAFAESESFEAVLAVPLIWQEAVIGVMMALSLTPARVFLPADQELLGLFANHAAIAIENARLLERERASATWARSLQEMGALLTSELGLTEVLENVLDLLAQVTPYNSISIQLIEADGRLHLAAGRGFPDFARAQQAVANLGTHILTEKLVERKLLVIPDTLADPRWIVADGVEYIRSWVGAPLLVKGRLIGVLNMDSAVPNAYDARTGEMVMAFAHQAAIAIENARLFESERAMRRRLETLRATSLTVTASLDLPQVLDAILSAVFDLMPDVEDMRIFLYHAESERLEFGAARWVEGAIATTWKSPRPDGMTWAVARSGQAVIAPDMQQHPLFIDTNWQGAILGLPLKIGTRVVGVMNIAFAQPRHLPESLLNIMQMMADHAAIAIENARLFQQAATERRHLELLYAISRDLSTQVEADVILQRALNLVCPALDSFLGEGFLYVAEEASLSLRALYGSSADPAVVRARSPMPLGQGLAGWVAQQRQIQFVPDLSRDPRWQTVPDLEEPSHAAICAPVMADDELLGVVTILLDQHVQPALPLALIQAFTQELALALLNARRYQQVQRRVTELTLIQSLTAALTQRLDLNRLLEEVVKQLVEQVGYPNVEIFLREGNELIQAVSRGMPPRAHRLRLEDGVVGRCARTGQIQLVTDVAADPDFLAEGAGVSAELAAPILLSDQVFGVINIEMEAGASLGLHDRALLEILSGQISVAVENALLYERVRRHAEDLEDEVAQRTAELTELYQLSQEISYQLSYRGLLQLLLGHLQNAVRSEWALGCLLVDDPRLLWVRTDRPLAPVARDRLRQFWREALAQQGISLPNGDQVQIEIIPSDIYLADLPPIRDLHTPLLAPVILNEDMVGLLMMGNEGDEPFSEEQIRLASTFANQATGAIQRLQTVLAAQQRNLESLVDHIPLGTLLYDADFKLLVVNPMGQEILATLEEGQSAESAPLNTLRLTELVSQTARALLNGETQPLATIEISQAGPPLRTFALLVSPVGDEARQWVVTIRETTQEREAQARIQSQERLAVVGQLAAGIAHDFNNIMAAILVYADLLLSDPHLPRASADKLTIIQQQVQRAASLIRQILDFSRRSVMEQSPLDLLPFIKELDKLLARVLPETIRLDLVYQPVEYWVNADPTRLQQVFMNLALNARDAMPNGGRLRFELSRFTQVAGQPPPLPDLSPGEWVRIIVSDTGPGIPPEARAHIFEPFFTTKPIGRGTGLGLAQVYGIIRQHDGYIDVQSEPGTGATFRIFLPLRRPLVEGNSPGEQIRPLMGRGQQILVVEDDEATRSALRALLEASHFHVTTASNGIEALRLLNQPNTPPFQLVISDLVMPRMGGLALYQAMQAQGMQIKILFITGHPLDEASQDLLEAGRVHWLQKPFSMQTFNQAVRAILGTGPLR